MSKLTVQEISVGKHFLKWVPYLLIVWCLAWMAYGFAKYPHASIKPCGDKVFCDKRHTLYTQEDYDQFQRWQIVLFMSWPFGMGGGYVIRRRKRRAAMGAAEKLQETN